MPDEEVPYLDIFSKRCRAEQILVTFDRQCRPGGA
jgi:hypothetical protein